MADELRPSQAFLHRFLGPLLAGDEVTIGLPVDRPCYEEVAAEVATRGSAVQEFEVTIQERVNHSLPEPPLVTFDEDMAKLAVAEHQLLFSFHASAEQGKVSESRLNKLAADTAALLSSVGGAAGRADVIARHFLVDPFFLLYRKDVQLFFRLGSKQFFGEEIEWLRLPFRWRPKHEEIVGTDVAVDIFRRDTGVAFGLLLALSPMTRLVRADRLFLEFDFRGLAPVLDDQVLTRFAVNTIIDRGLAAYLPALARGYRALHEQRATAAVIRQASQLLLTLAMTQVVWRPDDSDYELLDARYSPPSDAMRFEAPELAASYEDAGASDHVLRTNGVREGWALIEALAYRADALGLVGSPLDAEIIRQILHRVHLMGGTLDQGRSAMRPVAESLLG